MQTTIDKYSNIIALTLLKAEEQERENEAMAFRAVVTDNEFKFFLDLRSMFKAQEKEVLAKLEFLKDMTDMFMFDYVIWESNLRRMSYKHMTKVSTENGTRVFNDLKKMSKRAKDLLLQTTYDSKYPETLEYLEEQSIKLAGTVTTTTEEQIRAQLTNGFVEGLTVDEIATNISRVFSVASSTRAKMIARSEMSRAANYGAISAYRQSNMVEAKEWLTAKDELVCEFCSAMDKQVEDLSTAFLLNAQAFEGDDGTMMTNNYLDVQAAPLHVSCRCTILPVVKEFITTKTDDPVQAMFHSAKDGEYYLKKKERYAKILTNTYASSRINMSKDNFATRAMLAVDIFRDTIKPSTQSVLNGWKFDTNSVEGMVLRYQAAKLENDAKKIVWKNSDIEKIVKAAYNATLPKKEYLKIRAFSQAYMSLEKITSTRLYRGTNGKTGKAIVADIKELPQTTKSVNIQDRVVAGYSLDSSYASYFGSRRGGFNIRQDISSKDIILHNVFIEGGALKGEQENIIFSGMRKVSIKDIRYTEKDFGETL